MIGVNAAAQLVALGAVIILQAIYGIVVARVLGVDDFGRFSFMFATIQILIIGGDLGLHNTAIRRISAEPDRAENLFGTFLSLKFCLSVLLLLIVGLVASLWSDTVEARLALVCFGLGMFVFSVNMTLSISLQAHGKLYLASLNNVLAAFVQLGAAVIVLIFGGRLIGLGLAYAAAMVVALGANAAVFTRKIHPIRLGWLGGWKEFSRESLPVGLGTMFHSVSSRIDVTLLTWLAGTYQTGAYAAAYRFISVFVNVPAAISSAVLPVMAGYQDDRSEVRRLFTKILIFMAAGSLIVSPLLFLFSRPLIVLLYGDQYAPAALNLKVLAWSLIPIVVGIPFSLVMRSQRSLLKFLPWATGPAAAANVLLNLILIPRFGGLGAAFTTVFTEILLACLYMAGARRYLVGKP